MKIDIKVEVKYTLITSKYNVTCTSKVTKTGLNSVLSLFAEVLLICLSLKINMDIYKVNYYSVLCVCPF